MSLWEEQTSQTKIHVLYPTMIYESDLMEVESVNQEIDNIIDKVEFTSDHQFTEAHMMSGGHQEDDLISKYKLEVFSKVLSKNIKQYLTSMKSFDPSMSYTRQSWFTKMKKGHYSNIHNHGWADLSGVYYYKTSGDDGSLFIQTSNPHLDTSKLFFKYGGVTPLPPKVGRLYLFPGWLRHGVRLNKTDNTRISLSFNIILDNN
tara:strand:+ start:79 stop:687 length:609 start_codon:yes stop_codon:yes gene_type:complete